ncbi:MAG: DUF6169 family protein [Ginsengibacter sp.]
MDSNLQPYRRLRINDLTYRFTTDNGDSYKCFFLSFAEYFADYPELAPKFYSFNLELVNKPAKHKGIDKRIGATAVKIVGDFLNSEINAVVYVCDPSDGKGLTRARKFKSWFKYYEHSSHQILQVTSDIKIENLMLYTVLLVHKKNKLKKQFIDAYLDLTDEDK